MIRIGHGYDVHRLVPGRKLILGGVEIPHTTGLLGHSDADVLTHALMDALLGARKPLHALTRHDLRLTGADGECSIVRAMIQPALPGDILPIPDSMVSSQTMPSMMFPAQQLDPESLAELEEETEEAKEQEASDTAAGRSFKALWNKSKAIMGGTDDTAAKIPEISPNNETEMFTAFDPNAVQETPMTPSRMTTTLSDIVSASS